MRNFIHEVKFQHRLAWLLLTASLVLPMGYGAEIFGVMRGYLFLLLPPLTLLYLPAIAGLALSRARPVLAVVLNLLACAGWCWVLKSHGLMLPASHGEVLALGTLCAVGAALLGGVVALRYLDTQRAAQTRGKVLPPASVSGLPLIISFTWGVLTASGVWFVGIKLLQGHYSPEIGAVVAEGVCAVARCRIALCLALLIPMCGFMLVVAACTARPRTLGVGLLCAFVFAVPIAVGFQMLSHINSSVRAAHSTELNLTGLITVIASVVAMVIAAGIRKGAKGEHITNPGVQQQ